MSALFGGVGGRLDRLERMDDSTAHHLEGDSSLPSGLHGLSGFGS